MRSPADPARDTRSAVVIANRSARLLVGLSALLGSCLSVPPGLATTVIPVSDRQLAEHALAIVIGDVHAIESYWDGGPGQMFTHITLSVHEVLKGTLPDGELTIKQVGGTVGDLQSWVDGSPEFVRGERVLLFLRSNPDGTLRVAHLHQGKFSIFLDWETAAVFAYRQEAPIGVHVLGGVSVGGIHELEAFKTRIRAFAREQQRRAAGRAKRSVVTAPSPAVTQAQEQFRFLGSPSRWFEPDRDVPVTIFTNADGDPLVAGGGFDAIRAALAAWSSMPQSSFRYQDGGLTAVVGFRGDGVNAVSFDDPDGQIDEPIGCSGTLAIGGYFRNGETRTVNGTTFYRIVEGDVVINSGFAGCGFKESPLNYAEVVTHELGHVLGLGHSPVADATMYAIAHFDGRGASLRPDDTAGLAYMYPAASLPPRGFTLSVTRSGGGSGTVSGMGIDCGVDCAEVYTAGTEAVLTGRAMLGSVFSGWSGACSGTGPCTVVMDTDAEVVATFSPLPPSLPDLAEAEVSDPPASIRRGAKFRATDRVRNDGVAAETSTTTRYYLSTDGVRNGARRLTGTRTVPALATGGESAGSATVTVPLATSPGTYYLLACADDLGIVAESNLANNCKAAATQITVTR
jgi:hypothetical protein